MLLFFIQTFFARASEHPSQKSGYRIIMVMEKGEKLKGNKIFIVCKYFFQFLSLRIGLEKRIFREELDAGCHKRQLIRIPVFPNRKSINGAARG